MGVTIPEAVQATALVAAAARAAEQRGARPRIRDRFAERFVTAHADATGAAVRRLVAAGAEEVVHRTALIDALLTAHATAGSTVVNLGAGYCARPYRLDLSHCSRVMELDAEPVLRFKSRVLADSPPSCPVEHLVADVRQAGAVTCALSSALSAGGRAVVISEGLLVYLSPDELGRLAVGLAELPGDPVWLCDIVSDDSAAAMSMVADGARAGVRLYGLSSLEVFESAGWTVTDYRPLPGSANRPRRPGAGAARVIDGVLALTRS